MQDSIENHASVWISFTAVSAVRREGHDLRPRII